MNVLELRHANHDRGWLAIPETCPDTVVQRICERRAHDMRSEGHTAKHNHVVGQLSDADWKRHAQLKIAQATL